MSTEEAKAILNDEEVKKILDEYEAAYMPDTGLLSQLLELCKGGRTWQEFSSLCGKSAATLSRLSNKKITKQVGKDVLYLAYRNQVEQDNPDLDELMRAGGWRKKKKPRDRSNYVPWEPTEEEKAKMDQEQKDDENRRRMINIIIRSELDARGRMNLFYDNRRGSMDRRNPAMHDAKILSSDYGIRYSFGGGFTIQIQGMDPLYWCFFPTFSSLFGRPRDWGKYSEEDKERILNRMVANVMSDGFYEKFLKDDWEPETMVNIKTTIIFQDRVEYEWIWNVLKKRKVNNWFSLLLIDLENEKVLDERIIPRVDGKDQKMESIFKEPVMDYMEEEDPLDDEY